MIEKTTEQQSANDDSTKKQGTKANIQNYCIAVLHVQ